jgi:pimeloyl-ACP methyl ester carboxylesterase
MRSPVVAPPRAAMPEAQFCTVDGVRVRYADSSAAAKPVVVMTSPWPESIYAFQRIWQRVGRHARIFAFDLPGFGRSEQRPELLSPRAMGEFIVRLIDQVGLGRPHLLAPDVGTSAALFAAVAHPESVASVIVGNGGTAVPLALGEPLASWVLDPDIDRYLEMDPHAIVDSAVSTIVGGITAEVRDDYRSSYEGDRFIASMQYVRRYPEEPSRGRARGCRLPPSWPARGRGRQRSGRRTALLRARPRTADGAGRRFGCSVTPGAGAAAPSGSPWRRGRSRRCCRAGRGCSEPGG